jgi:hypothetical protein
LEANIAKNPEPSFGAATPAAGASPSLPEGDYHAQPIYIAQSHSNDGRGMALIFVFQITDGPHTGQTVETSLSVGHPDPLPREIAHGQLAEIYRALEILEPRGIWEMYGRRLRITVGVRVCPELGQAVNFISAYSRSSL